MTAPQALLKFPETRKGVKWVHSKRKFVTRHYTWILIQSFHLKSPPVHNLYVIFVFPFWVLLESHLPTSATFFLSAIYHHPIMEGEVIRYMFLSIQKVKFHLFYINIGHPVIINFIDPLWGFTVQLALCIFRYVHIAPALLMLTIILKLLPAHPWNTLRFFPGTVILKLVFQHEDDLA